MIIIKSEIGEKLRELRRQKEETLNSVSNATGIVLALLSKIETGARLPTQEQIIKLAAYYKYSESELKTLSVAEKIIKDYGISEETQKAIYIVKEQIEKYLKK